MTDSTETTEQLIQKAKQCIDNNQLAELKLILQKTYMATVLKSDEVPVTKGSYELGLYDEIEIVHYEASEKRNHFGIDEKKALLAHALERNNLEIIDWFMSKGYLLNINQFASFCDKNNNTQNNPLVEKICNRYLTLAIYNNNVEFIKTVLKYSPHFKGNKESVQRLNTIAPLFQDLTYLEYLAEDKRAENNQDAAKKVDAYCNTTHGHIKNFLTGRTTGEAFLNLTTSYAKDSMAELAKTPEALTIFKNILLTLTIIGPFIKKWETGQWLYENSTTAKVRETTDKVKDMKESLMKFKFFANPVVPKPEPESEPEPEQLHQPT